MQEKTKINRLSMILLTFLGILFVNSAFAFPKQIVIIRHGDKLVQPESGAALSPKGMIRSIAFAFYYLNKFGEPDYIFAVDPKSGKGSSIRELQTVAPLANMLAAKHPDNGFPILYPDQSSEYSKLADELLNNKNFDGKRILICWNHRFIPQLTAQLGVKRFLKSWPADDYDTVYLIKYDEKGRVNQFIILKRQYPVVFSGSWNELYKKIS